MTTYTTWNPSDNSGVTLSGGNLVATGTFATFSAVRSVDRWTSGKYYFEATLTTTNNSPAIGLATAGIASLASFRAAGQMGQIAAVNGATLPYYNGIQLNIGTASFTTGHVYGIAFDLTAGLFWIKDVTGGGNWNNNASANPATGAVGISLAQQFVPGLTAVYAICGFGGPDVWTTNFGATSFTGTVPTGFTAGLPQNTPTLTAGATQALLEVWTGTPIVSPNRVSTLFGEVIADVSPPSNRVSTLFAEVIGVPTPPSSRVSTLFGEVISDPSTPPAGNRFSNVFVEVIANPATVSTLARQSPFLLVGA